MATNYILDFAEGDIVYNPSNNIRALVVTVNALYISLKPITYSKDAFIVEMLSSEILWKKDTLGTILHGNKKE